MVTIDHAAWPASRAWERADADLSLSALAGGPAAVEDLLRRIASGSEALRLLTREFGLDHFKALALIKSLVAGGPVSQPWRQI